MDRLDMDKTVMPSDDSHSASFEPGCKIGSYNVIKLLGRGGMGEVYEVEHQVLHQKYALKLLPPVFASRPDALARFQREAQVMAKLRHPHIVYVDDFGESDGRYWLRMELVEGQSLQDYADSLGGKVPQKQLLEILKQATDGLAYAHDHGAIHRDLKPSNILLDGDELKAKIADFGLVRLVGEEWVRSQAQISAQSITLNTELTLQEGSSAAKRDCRRYD